MTPSALETVVVDASIIVKLASHEGESNVSFAHRFYQNVKSGSIHAFSPDFLLIEVAHVLLWKKKLAPERVEGFVKRILTSGLRFLPFSHERSSEIVPIMHRHHLSAYDSLYVLVARDHKCRLLTADERLLKVPGVGVSLQEFYRVN